MASDFCILKVLICIIPICTYKCCGSSINEGERYTLHATFQHNLKEDLEIVWLVNEETVSQCSVTGGCVDDFEDKTNTSLTYDTKTGIATCDIYINRMTIEYLGHWKLKYLGNAGLEYPDYIFAGIIYDNTSRTNYSMNSSLNNSITNYHVFESDCEKRDVIIPDVENEISIPLLAFVVAAILSSCSCCSIH